MGSERLDIKEERALRPILDHLGYNNVQREMVEERLKKINIESGHLDVTIPSKEEGKIFGSFFNMLRDILEETDYIVKWDRIGEKNNLSRYRFSLEKRTKTYGDILHNLDTGMVMI